MRFDVKVFFNELYLTTVFGVEANTEAEAVDIVREDMAIDFDVEPHE